VLADAWFLQRATRKNYSKGATKTPDSKGCYFEASFFIKAPPVINKPIADEVFSPMLPPDTRVTGDVIPASFIMKHGQSLASIPMRSGRGRKVLAAKDWSVLGGVNIAVLGVCVGWRRRWQF
jgi:hypothetical protein